MLLGKDCGHICDPEQVNGKYEDFIGVYHRFVHHELCTAIVDQFEKYLTTNPGFLQHGKDQFAEKKLGRNDVGMMLDDVDLRLSQHLYQYINTAFERLGLNYKKPPLAVDIMYGIMKTLVLEQQIVNLLG
jgi:hypothetical protein